LAYLDQQKLSPEEMMEHFQGALANLDLTSGGDIGLQLGFTTEYFDAMYSLGVKYYDNNRLDDAIKVFYELIPLQPSAFRNYKAMGACLQAKEDYETAIKVYSSAVVLAAMDAEIHFYVGQCQFLMKDFAEAEKTLRMANRICEKHPEKWNHIAHYAKELHTRAQERSSK
jgi:tetratricopeptide (TPR) repeat protein